jgi:ketosteroid isomerase-like protein
MIDHPNFVTTQKSWDALTSGDLMTALDLLADDLVVDNGPGAGPWRHIEGKEAFFAMAMQFVPFFQGTWAQEGRCIYADDHMSIALVRETGKAPSGDDFDNLAVYVYRFNEDGKVNRLWTTDIAHEALEAFWSRNPIDTTA